MVITVPIPLVIQGNQAVLVRDGGELIDLVQKGQGVLNVLALSGVVHDVDAAIVELHPVADASVTRLASGN